ncbi:MAG: glycosyltransferase family 4 protein [Cyanobacteria bacterium P01_G01_bin.4]
MVVSAGKPYRVLVIVENLPVPFDRRVWQECNALKDAGYEVNVICPTGKDYESKYEVLNDIHIFRHDLSFEAKGSLGYFLEYSLALFWEFFLAWKVFFTRGFDCIHACNPPDTIFLIGAVFRLFGKKFLFDHHDINPELYIAKFGRQDLFYKCLLLFEKLTFRLATVSIATNQSYRKIAIERGGMPEDRVFVVRSGPKLDRLQILEPVPELKHGREFMIGYVGVIGQQEGIQYLLKMMQYIVFEQKRDDIHCTVVGGGPALDDMKQMAIDLGVDSYVTFTGRAPDRLLLEVLNTADVCVNPDEGNEMNDKSTMNKIMEYMALGKPIVQFDLTEGRFLAQEASLYCRWNDHVDLADKVLELLASPEKRQKMGEFGRKRVEQELEWSNEIPKLLKAYETLRNA